MSLNSKYATPLAALERQPSLTAQAYHSIKETIVNGSLAPSTPCTEAGFARQLGISRAPVREAMRQLQEEGLIDQTSATGFAVAGFTAQTVADVYGIRFALESMAARLATGNIPAGELDAREAELDSMKHLPADQLVSTVKQADFAFHDLWVTHSGNVMLERHIGRLRDHVVRASNLLLMPDEHYAAARQEHLAIVHAIRGQDSTRIQDAVEAHVRCVRDRLLAAAGVSR